MMNLYKKMINFGMTGFMQERIEKLEGNTMKDILLVTMIFFDISVNILVHTVLFAIALHLLGIDISFGKSILIITIGYFMGIYLHYIIEKTFLYNLPEDKKVFK